MQDAAKGYFDAYWNYRTKAPEKGAEYVKAFSADPTVASPAIPVKVEENDQTTLQAPTGPAAGTVKLSSGGAPGAGGKAANGNGKTTTTKGKAAPKAAPKKRKR